mmetsp:Transcript_38985/g.125258  ORF Transcript_38985/g.125258 Transcript_38985/m.125258 type:complete len:331 (-) Transcript_38985:192-1184(-)
MAIVWAGQIFVGCARRISRPTCFCGLSAAAQAAPPTLTKWSGRPTNPQHPTHKQILNPQPRHAEVTLPISFSRVLAHPRVPIQQTSKFTQAPHRKKKRLYSTAAGAGTGLVDLDLERVERGASTSNKRADSLALSTARICVPGPTRPSNTATAAEALAMWSLLVFTMPDSAHFRACWWSCLLPDLPASEPQRRSVLPPAAAPRIGTPPAVMEPVPGAWAKTRSNKSCSAVGASQVSKCPVPVGKFSGGEEPSASARRASRYQAAARVWYFSRMGKSSGMPCAWRKSWNRLLPPNSIIFKCKGFHESMVVDCTKLVRTPRLLWMPEAPMLR